VSFRSAAAGRRPWISSIAEKTLEFPRIRRPEGAPAQPAVRSSLDITPLAGLLGGTSRFGCDVIGQSKPGMWFRRSGQRQACGRQPRDPKRLERLIGPRPTDKLDISRNPIPKVEQRLRVLRNIGRRDWIPHAARVVHHIERPPALHFITLRSQLM